MSAKGFRLSLIATLGLTTVGLSGCFHATDSASPTETTALISGVTSKGIIVGGKVYAYPIIDGLVVKAIPLGEATTNPSGKYTISISNYTGPVAVVVKPASDGSSKVKCDVPNVDGGCTTDGTPYTFGQLMPFDYELEALVPNVTGGSSLSVSVTPLTNMAAAYARDLGLASNGDTIRLANEKAAKLLGLGLDDILSVEPVDVTDPIAVGSANVSLASIKYGYLAASIAAIANDDADGDVGTTIDNLAKSFVDAKGELTGEEMNDQPDLISLAEITDGALGIMAAEEDVSGVFFTEVKDEIEKENVSAKSVGDTATSTETETVVAEDNVEAAKAIVTELRTWGSKLNDDMMSGSDGTMAKAEAVMDSASADFEDVVMAMAEGVMAVVDAYAQRQAGDIVDGTFPLSDFTSGKSDFFGEDEGYGESSSDEGSETGDFFPPEYTFADDGTLLGMDGMPVDPDSIISDGFPPQMGGNNDVQFKVGRSADNAMPSAMGSVTGDVIVAGNTVSLSNAKINGVDVTLSITGPQMSGTVFTVTLGASSASNANVELVFDKSFATVEFVDNVTDITMLGESDKPKKVTLNLAAKLGHKADSEVKNRVNFEGAIDAVAFVVYSTWANGDVVEDYNPGRIVFDGAFSVTAETTDENGVKTTGTDAFNAKLEARMVNAETFKQPEPKFLAGETYPDFATYSFSADGNVLAIEFPESVLRFTYDETTKRVSKERASNDGSDRYSWDTYFEYANQEFGSLDDFIQTSYKLSGGSWQLNISGDSYDAYVMIDAPASWSKSGGSISATVNYAHFNGDENIDNWRNVDGELTIAAKFEGLPEASIVANVDRYGYQAATGSLTLKYDDVTIVVAGDIDANDENNISGELSVIVKTATGELAIYPDVTIGGIRGSVKVNGVVVGSIRESNMNDEAWIVTYVNGEFEIVNF